ncbi:putative ATPase [Rhizobium sp. BK251]|nr:putative ATPase [Rhizobium sp. BK251]
MAGDGESRTGEIVFFGPFDLAPAERLLARDGTPVPIGGRALDILIALTGRAGQVLSVRELIDLVWPDVTIEESNIRVNMTALRKALRESEDGARYIVNIPGRGYSFVAPVRRGAPEPITIVVTPAASARPTNLPPPPRFLVGRSDAIDMLSSLLLSRRFVSVVGPGGIGKTTVAVAVAHALRREFEEDAVCFVDLGSLTDPADAPSAFASALGCVVQGPDPEPYIAAFLADRRMLVVFDNCEHVIGAASALAERLLRAAPSVHLLATSREALRAEGENVHLLPPLESPHDRTPSAAQALASAAVQLFMERAASSGHRAELSETEAPVVASICRRLDGLALAIELVASRVGTYGIQGTADLLDSDVELQLRGRRTASPRHQTLQAMLDWSFNLLPGYEREILCRLSVFVGQFTLEAAHAVAGDAEGGTMAQARAINSLVDKSLILVSSTSGPAYYRLLDTTRAYAAAKLSDSGHEDAVARRHAGYFAGFLEASAAGPGFDGREAANHAFHLGNVRKALAWSFSSSGDRSIGVELAAQAAPLFLSHSLLKECLQWCRQGLNAMQESDRGTLRELKLQEALAMASMYTQGNSQEVGGAIERGLELSETLGDKQHQLHLLSSLNHFLTRRGDFGGALEAARRSAAVTETWGSPAEKAMTEWLLGAAHHLAGDQAAALRHCESGFRLMSDVAPGGQDFFGYDLNGRALATLARSLWLRGFPDQACKVARQGIEGLNRFTHPVSYCMVVLYCVPVFHWTGDVKGAAEHTDRAIAHAIKYSLGPHRTLGLALKGELTVASGDPSSGVEILRQALRAMDGNQYHIVTLATSRALAEGLALSGHLDDALATIDEAVARAEEASQTLWPPDLLRARGEILLAQPQPDLRAAEESLLQSIRRARQQSALGWELKAAIPLARLWNDQGRSNEAWAMLKDIYGQFTEGFETRDLVAARRLLDELGHATPEPVASQG